VERHPRAEDREVAGRIQAGMLAAWRNRVRHIEGHAIHHVDGLVVFLSNLPMDDLNVALVEREPQDALEALSRAEWWFGVHGRTLGVEIELGRHRRIESAIDIKRLEMVVRRSAMAVRTADLAEPVLPDGVRISRVDEASGLRALVDLNVDTFGMDRSVAERFLGPTILRVPEIRNYVATLEDEPVAVAGIDLHDGAVGVFGVATIELARRRGIGTAITSFAALDAPGADLAWLHPTPMGQRVYERMGFRPVSDWSVWVRTSKGVS
jgi:GNAT superfamily N-acetyltransferase